MGTRISDTEAGGCQYELLELCGTLRKGRQTKAETQHMAQQGAYHPHEDSSVFQEAQALGNHRP